MTENDDDTKVGVVSFGGFLTFLQVIMQFAFDQTKEREKNASDSPSNLFHIRRSLHLISDSS